MSLFLAKCSGQGNAAEQYHVDSDPRSQEALQFLLLQYFCFWDLCHLHLLINLGSLVCDETQPNYPHWLSQQIANNGYLSEAILGSFNCQETRIKSRCMRAQRPWPSCPDQKDCSAYTQNHKPGGELWFKVTTFGGDGFLSKAIWYRLVTRIYNCAFTVSHGYYTPWILYLRKDCCLY